MASLSPSSTTMTPPPLPGLAASMPQGPLNHPLAITAAWSAFLPPNLPFVSPLELGKMRVRAHRNPNSQIQEEEEKSPTSPVAPPSKPTVAARGGREGGAMLGMWGGAAARTHHHHRRGEKEGPRRGGTTLGTWGRRRARVSMRVSLGERVGRIKCG
jgi:hypothetical protein